MDAIGRQNMQSKAKITILFITILPPIYQADASLSNKNRTSKQNIPYFSYYQKNS